MSFKLVRTTENAALTALSLIFLTVSTSAYAQDAATTESGAFIIDNAQQTAVSETETAPIPLTDAEKFALAMQEGFADLGETGAEFAAFYASRDYAPIWADGNSLNISNLVSALGTAPDHGLPLGRYFIADLQTNATTPEAMAALEVAAATSYATFAKDMKAGMLDPKAIDKEMNATRYVPETADVLRDAATASDLVAFYDTLYPQTDDYRGLMALKQELATLVTTEGWGPQVPAGRTLRPGGSDERVLALRVRLDHRGYDVLDMESSIYDEALVDVVKQFQTDFGLNADGLAGPQTLAAINTQPNGRLRQVLVNLERARWMNYDLGSRHIYVNIPDFHASLMDDGYATRKFRVVVGQNRHQTAEFSDEMTHLIANPTWHVPYSIASKEYYPQLLRDPTVLARSNIRMLYRGTGQVIDSTMVDYSQYSSSNFPFVLQQRPGRGNALGRVKFMFPNKYNIYLHDTPSKSLFERDARAYSHGCIRVQDPIGFAHDLLAPQETDPVAAFQAALDSGRETQIDLVNPIPVHIVYRTVWIDTEGEPQYRHDVYGRDDLVVNQLMSAGVTLTGVEG